MLRLLTLLAMLIMPLGMAPASAAATRHEMARMAMGHCPDQAPSHDTKGAFAACTMACSAALPAMDGSATLPPRIACVPVDCPAAKILMSLVPEIATPPPKNS